MNIEELFSERALDDKKFKSVIIQPTQDELNSIHRDIQVFPHLVSLDYAPNKFMQLISDLFGFKFLETEDPTVQREILKRLVAEYHRKGLFETLQKIANRGYSDNFYLGDLTYYHDKIEEGYSSITFPRDMLFRYDYSRWDGHDRWPDAKEWRDGVVEIDISVPTDPQGRIIELIDFHLAAGLKYYISILRDLSGDTGYINMVYKVLDDIHEVLIHDDIGLLPPYVITGNYFRYDYSRWDYKRWGSREVISHDTWEERKPQAAIHNIFYPIDFGYTVAEVWDEPFIYNWNRFCGVIGGYVEPDLTNIDLNPVYYPYEVEETDTDYYNDFGIVKPYITADNEFVHDSNPYDDMMYDSHIVASVEIIEEHKHKEQFRLDDTKIIDEVAWDGDEVPV